MSSATRKALVLSGGGAYGAFAVGVMKALSAGRSPSTDYQLLKADIFTGTSVGAFNAALMVSGWEQDCLKSALRLEDIWLNRIAERPGGSENGIFRLKGNPVEYLDVSHLRSPVRVAAHLVRDALVAGGYALDRTANFLASSQPLINRAIQLVNVASFIDTEPYQDLLRNVIDEEKILHSPMSFRAIATDWITGRAVPFGNEDFKGECGIKAIMASSALPGIFPPVVMGADVLVDGGVVDNTPLKTAIDLGATELHVVYLDPQPKFIPVKGEPSTIDTLIRVYTLMLAANVQQDFETARRINAGIRALPHYAQTGQSSLGEARNFLGVASRPLNSSGASYKTLIVHRYFPTSVLGGDTGMLDFGLDRIARIIEEGERVALVHDCIENRCILN